MPGEINCIFTKSLIPFVEREVGEEGVAALLPRGRALARVPHGRPQLAAPAPRRRARPRLAMTLLGETDEERWGRRWGDYHMDWKPSHE